MKISPLRNICVHNSRTEFSNNKQKTQNFKECNFISYPENYYLSFSGVKNIRFEKAKTIPEAKAFGRKVLGVAQYSNFDNEQLDVINYINEGLVALKNNSRTKQALPRYINLEECDKIQMSTRFTGSELTVSRNIYGAKEINSEIERIFTELRKDGVFFQKGNNKTLNPDIAGEDISQFFSVLCDKYDKIGELNYDEKIDLYNDIRVIYERTSQLNRFPKDLILKMLEAGCWGEFDSTDVELFKDELSLCDENDKFITLYNFLKEYDKLDFGIKNDSFRHKTLFHEVGHLQDYDLFYSDSVGEFSSPKTYSKEIKRWLDDKIALKTAFKVSPYACFGKGEFIAEVYASKIQGKELSEDIEELYKKYRGPRVLLRHN